MKRVDRVAEYLRTSLWVVPAFGVAAAVAAALGVVAVDDATGAELGFGGSAETARSILSTIAAAMITFTGLVFSITIVALQLASGQFSPRVMRTFLRDTTSKIALATFVATFTFSLTVLRAVHVDAVPGISVSVAIVLVFASVAVFIHYIDHTAHAIRAAAIIESVAEETRAALERLYPKEVPPALPEPELRDDATLVLSGRPPGVMTGYDSERMLALASEADAVVVLRAGVGDFVPEDAPLLDLHGADPERCDVAACVSLGQERTMQQDVAFGIRQLADLATKALSPGINDPTTAVQAMDQIHDLLRKLAVRPMRPGRIADESGTVRIVSPTMEWDDFVSLAFDEIRIYGAGSLQVLRRLHGALEDLTDIVADERLAPLREQLDLLRSAAEREFPDERDRRFAAHSDAQGLGS